MVQGSPTEGLLQRRSSAEAGDSIVSIQMRGHDRMLGQAVTDLVSRGMRPKLTGRLARTLSQPRQAAEAASSRQSCTDAVSITNTL